MFSSVTANIGSTATSIRSDRNLPDSAELDGRNLYLFAHSTRFSSGGISMTSASSLKSNDLKLGFCIFSKVSSRLT